MASSSPPEVADATGNQPVPAPEDTELLRRLVAIESLSDQEHEAVAELVAQMDRRGFRTEIDSAGSAIGTIGNGPKRVILLGHIDTVPGRIPVRIEDGVLYGRGAVDAKGPLCTFVAAATRAAANGNATITVVGAAGEERMGSPGATAVATWPAPDFCVIGEPSGWDTICLGYRGTLSLRYHLREGGRHSAGPGEAVAEQAVGFWNAVVAEADAFNATVTARGNFNTLTPTLRGINTASDGLEDEAILAIGVRLPPGFEVQPFVDRLRALAGEADLTVEGVQEAYRSDKRSPLVPPFLRAIRAEGGNPRFTVKLGTADITVVGPVWQCPIVAYGPGDASLDHTPHEHIVLADYARAINVLTNVLESL